MESLFTETPVGFIDAPAEENSIIKHVEDVQKEENFSYTSPIFAYKTDDKGEIIDAYQGMNPPEDFTHIYNSPLAPGSKIVAGVVSTSDVFMEKSKAAKFDETNTYYKTMLTKLREAIGHMYLLKLDTTQVEEAYALARENYKQALLNIAGVSIKND